jgi:hypothetical protein
MDWTQNIPYNRLCQFLTSKCNLTLEVGTQMLRMTFHLIIVTTVPSIFQNPLIYKEVMDRTQNIPNNRLCKHFTSKCDIDIRGKDAVVVLDISSYYCDFLCQVISKSLKL